jgi:flavodoxin I
MKIGLFYSSDTGNTETVAEMIQEEVGKEYLDVHEVFAIDLPKTIAEYDFIIIGVPTWYDGEVQNEWADKLNEFKKIDLSGRKVAVYGLGDQEDWGEYFCDAIAELAEKAQESGGTIIGHWPSEGYDFTESRALIDKDTFIGLTLDEDRQSDLTEDRVQTWLEQLKKELNVDHWSASIQY